MLNGKAKGPPLAENAHRNVKLGSMRRLYGRKFSFFSLYRYNLIYRRVPSAYNIIENGLFYSVLLILFQQEESHVS